MIRSTARFQPLAFAAAAFIALAALLMPVASAFAAGYNINFTGYAAHTPAEQLGLAGMTAGSPFSPNSWQVMPNAGDWIGLSGNALRNSNCSAALVIALDQAYTHLTLRYAVTASTQVLKVEGWLGNPGPGTLQFNRSLTGANQGSPTGWREGSLGQRGAQFDHLVIYSPGGCAAMDNVAIW